MLLDFTQLLLPANAGLCVDQAPLPPKRRDLSVPVPLSQECGLQGKAAQCNSSPLLLLGQGVLTNLGEERIYDSLAVGSCLPCSREGSALVPVWDFLHHFAPKFIARADKSSSLQWGRGCSRSEGKSVGEDQMGQGSRFSDCQGCDHLAFLLFTATY